MGEVKKDFEKEIAAVENILKLLNQCLAIALKYRRNEAVKDTLNDIHLCKEELRKLQDEKMISEKAAAKEKAKNVLQRSRTGFS